MIDQFLLKIIIIPTVDLGYRWNNRLF